MFIGVNITESTLKSLVGSLYYPYFNNLLFINSSTITIPYDTLKLQIFEDKNGKYHSISESPIFDKFRIKGEYNNNNKTQDSKGERKKSNISDQRFREPLSKSIIIKEIKKEHWSYVSPTVKYSDTKCPNLVYNEWRGMFNSSN